MITTGNREIDFLLALLPCAIKGAPFPDSEGVDFDKLLTLANRQQVYSMVLPALEKSGKLSPGQKQDWNNCRLSELRKTLVVDSERESICEDLDREKIKYMFLKGLNIREYYPMSSMRQMSDNDILYDERRQKDLYAIMKDHGYYLGTCGENSDDFYKKPYATFEFHRSLFYEGHEFCPDFDPWKNSTPYKEGSSRRVMCREDNYIYAIAHMYKHYSCVDGCGIRFVCDAYVLSHSDDKLDWDYINSEFEHFGIAGFHNTVQTVSNAVFEDGELDKDGRDLLDFLFEGGVYGLSHFDINKEVEEHGSKLGYILYRIFPPAEHMKKEYKTLEKKPYLLPFYYIYRLFDKYKHSREHMDRDLNALKNMKKDNKNKEDK